MDINVNSVEVPEAELPQAPVWYWRLDKRIRHIERWMIVMATLLLTPRLGGPEPSEVLTSAARAVSRLVA